MNQRKWLLAGFLSVLLVLTACTGGQTAHQQDATRAPTAPPEETETGEEIPEEDPEKTEGATLVVYFSATGSTERVAGFIAENLGADTYEITPEEAYTAGDLDWRDESSRVSVEHEDPALRPALAGELPELENYDTVFLGYPLWWRQAPHVVCTFLESVGLSGKTVIPFCTSSSSELGDSAENLHALAPDAQWQEGIRFPSRVEESEVLDWVEGLNLSE